MSYDSCDGSGSSGDAGSGSGGRVDKGKLIQFRKLTKVALKALRFNLGTL